MDVQFGEDAKGSEAASRRRDLLSPTSEKRDPDSESRLLKKRRQRAIICGVVLVLALPIVAVVLFKAVVPAVVLSIITHSVLSPHHLGIFAPTDTGFKFAIDAALGKHIPIPIKVDAFESELLHDDRPLFRLPIPELSSTNIKAEHEVSLLDEPTMVAFSKALMTEEHVDTTVRGSSTVHVLGQHVPFKLAQKVGLQGLKHLALHVDSIAMRGGKLVTAVTMHSPSILTADFGEATVKVVLKNVTLSEATLPLKVVPGESKLEVESALDLVKVVADPRIQDLLDALTADTVTAQLVGVSSSASRWASLVLQDFRREIELKSADILGLIGHMAGGAAGAGAGAGAPGPAPKTSAGPEITSIGGNVTGAPGSTAPGTSAGDPTTGGSAGGSSSPYAGSPQPTTSGGAAGDPTTGTSSTPDAVAGGGVTAGGAADPYTGSPRPTTSGGATGGVVGGTGSNGGVVGGTAGPTGGAVGGYPAGGGTNAPVGETVDGGTGVAGGVVGGGPVDGTIDGGAVIPVDGTVVVPVVYGFRPHATPAADTPTAGTAPRT